MSTPAQFEVWAPLPHEVQLCVDGVEYAMERDAERTGWWFVSADVIAPRQGQCYWFNLFDGLNWVEGLPDPRTRAQPEGIHGPSEIVPTHFAWADQEWAGRQLRGQVIYELHVGTFSPAGTFAGVVEKLDYLAELGVSTIELMPVQPFGGDRNWGYDGVDWFAVQESYGGPLGLKELVNSAHQKGIAVILDVVYNHFGPDGNYNPLFGPYLTSGFTDWGDVVNLSDSGSDEVRAYILDAVRQWLDEFHLDGLRLDAVHAYDDRRAYSIMEEIRSVSDDVASTTRVPRTIIGETDQNDPRIVNDEADGGYGLSAQWLDDVHHCIHTLVTGEHQAYYMDYGTTAILADTLKNAYRFRGNWSHYRGRSHGRPLDLEKVSPWRMITYTTTHDQTGNRASGDRPSQSLTPSQQVLKAAVVLCSPFTPMLFMGEEFGARTPFPFFCSHTDDELNRLTREGRLSEFSRLGWTPHDVVDPAAQETFDSARLSWEFDHDQREIFQAYQRLLRLRQRYKFTRDDLRELQVDHGESWLTMGYDDVILVANFSEQRVCMPEGGRLIYSFGTPVVTADETTLEPWGCAIIERASA